MDNVARNKLTDNGRPRLVGVLFEAARGMYGTSVVDRFDVEWSEPAIRSVFPTREDVSKDTQQLWSASTYRDDATRGNDGIAMLHAAMLDYDCGDIGELDRVCDALIADRRAYFVYTSWSHRDISKVHKGSGKPGPFDCFRVILPFSRPVTVDEYKAIVPALYGHEVAAALPQYLAEVAESKAQPRGWDIAGERPSQGFFVPPNRGSASEVIEVNGGAPLDVDAILARPRNARAQARGARVHHAPTATGNGALGRVLDAMTARGAWVSTAERGGWQRAACPSCAPDGSQRSPSFRLRADGDGVVLYCHAGCHRKDVVRALGLTPDFERATRPATNVEARAVEQLRLNRPTGELLPADIASQRERDRICAPVTGRLEVHRGVAGLGKSESALHATAKDARAGHLAAIAMPDHANLSAAKRRLSVIAPDVPSLRMHSVLEEDEDGNVCRFRDEYRTNVLAFASSMPRDVCPTCKQKKRCKALASHTQRQKEAERIASGGQGVLFVSHAGVGQVLRRDNQDMPVFAGLRLYVDEMPQCFKVLKIDIQKLDALSSRTALPWVAPEVSRHVQVLASCALAKVAPPVETIEWARDWRRVPVSEGATLSGDDRDLLEAAHSLVQIAAHVPAGDFLAAGSAGLLHSVRTDAYEALHGHDWVKLLTATPFDLALPHDAVRMERDSVLDGAVGTRVLVARTDCGQGALTQVGLDDKGRARKGKGDGIAWSRVEAFVKAALEHASDGRILYVTFKAIIDALNADRPGEDAKRIRDLMADRFELAYFGNVRGRNDWAPGAPRACQTVAVQGVPRFDREAELRELKLEGDALQAAWLELALHEVYQALDRVRSVRQRESFTMIVEADRVPLGWHDDPNVPTGYATLYDPDAKRAAGHAALDELRRHGLTHDELASELGVARQQIGKWLREQAVPPAKAARAISLTTIAGGVGLLARYPKLRWWDDGRELPQDFWWAEAA